MSENIIMTVKGYIPDTKLGFCHSHEHLFLADGPSAKLNKALRMDDFSKTVEELNLFKSVGGMSIVDAQPLGCGRMARSLLEASQNTGINIIASTGFHKLIFYPEEHWIRSMTEDELTQTFLNEFDHGMYVDGDTGIPLHHIPAKPGVIKTASDVEGVNDQYRRLFNAAARASVQTGTPVLSHTEMGKGAVSQVQVFRDYGVPAESIIICHLDRTVDDISEQLEVAQSGVYLEFDTIGRHKYHSDEDEARFIVKLIEHGYEDKILLGLDTTNERLKSYGGSLGLDYITTVFIPLLKEFGVNDEIIAKFMVTNPAKAFSNYRSGTKNNLYK